jgi:hypothetical protein
MSELPGRPSLDQLRRQARELLRAAAHGDPTAVARLRTVSARVTLSAAQLAVAREYGYRSWPALKAEVERRRLPGSAAIPPLPPGGQRGPLGIPGERWSFGGATAIATSAGILLPEALVADAGHATLFASVTPSGNGQSAAGRTRRVPVPRMPLARWVWGGPSRRARRRRAHAALATLDALVRPGELTAVDDRGARYTLEPEAVFGATGPSGQPAGPVSVRLRLDPVPGQGITWIELRRQDGSAIRLLPSPRPAVQVSQLAQASASPAERELLNQALFLIESHLNAASEAAGELLAQECSAALAKAAEVQQSGDLDPASELPDQLRQLCAVLTEHRPADRLPASWAGMLGAARQSDGPRHHLDIGAALPPIDGVSVQVDSLISGPGVWRLYLRATPRWWTYSQDGNSKWLPATVHAEDDRGGMYLSTYDGGTWQPDGEEPGPGEEQLGHEELALRFLPRLDPHARVLTLTFRGFNEKILVNLRLELPRTPT